MQRRPCQTCIFYLLVKHANREPNNPVTLVSVRLTSHATCITKPDVLLPNLEEGIQSAQRVITWYYHPPLSLTFSYMMHLLYPLGLLV